VNHMTSHAVARGRGSQLTTDPVCGVPTSRHSEIKTQYSGREFHFCSETCREKFSEEPENFVAPDPGEAVRVPMQVVGAAEGVAPDSADSNRLPGYIPKSAVYESHLQRSQHGSRSEVPDPSGAPDPFGEEAISVDEPPDSEVVGRTQPDDTVMPG
jgi:YHS domain-containing protein